MSIERHCDPVTMDHIIELRKRLRETERQRDNAIDQCTQLNKLVWNLRSQLSFPDSQITFPEGKPNDNDEDRNC